MIKLAEEAAGTETVDQHLIVEAGTGTGKGLAYILPIVRSGKVALLSTANKALQEQLFYKDIPFTQRHVQDFEAALVKGMGNYLCLDRYGEERAFQSLAPPPAVGGGGREGRARGASGATAQWLRVSATELVGAVRGRADG